MRALRVVAPDQFSGEYGRCSDSDLMSMLQDGDPAALGELIDRYWEGLVSFAMRIVGSRDDAEDVVQDTFVALWQHRERWTGQSSPTAYVYRITRNKSYNQARKETLRDRFRTELSAGPLRSTDPSESTSPLLAVAEAVAALPARRREVFILARMHGLTYRDIAATMEISTQTVANHMTAALDQLRRALT